MRTILLSCALFLAGCGGRGQGAPTTPALSMCPSAAPAGGAPQGTLDRGEILRVVNAHMHEVKVCYEKSLIDENTFDASKVSGRILFAWVIQPSGDVSTVCVRSSSVKSPEVGGCVEAAIKSWIFPPPQGGPVLVEYPFVFSVLGG